MTPGLDEVREAFTGLPRLGRRGEPAGVEAQPRGFGAEAVGEGERGEHRDGFASFSRGEPCACFDTRSALLSMTNRIDFHPCASS